ncbi:MAG: riboflavin synthase [Halieaceae bacterium]|jgi:riboflavin synthase
MFTGIIEAVGAIAAMEEVGGDLRLQVAVGKLDMSDVGLGDSISHNGVCLTVVEMNADSFWTDVSVETLNFTTLGSLQLGSSINLEKAMLATDRFGGHIVSGHVDGVGEIVSLHTDARSTRFRLRAPDDLAKYIAHKGSVCVDGTSLTVNAVDGAEFELNIIPQTMAETIFASYRSGSKVNLEVDIIARYLERLLCK